tara:strand:+ start:496 stop:861 length:366 start_codon:yes stop_codon:yes gene_type:complete
MKKIITLLLSFIFILSSCKKDENYPLPQDNGSLIITTNGMSFEPAVLNCNVGDVITFDLGSSHNAIEVSEQSYNASVYNPLENGFSFDFGESGEFIPTEAKTYYYVCAPHLPDMKAIIVVQ